MDAYLDVDICLPNLRFMWSQYAVHVLPTFGPHKKISAVGYMVYVFSIMMIMLVQKL